MMFFGINERNNPSMSNGTKKQHKTIEYHNSWKNLPNGNSMEKLKNNPNNLIPFSKYNTIGRKELIEQNSREVDSSN